MAYLDYNQWKTAYNGHAWLKYPVQECLIPMTESKKYIVISDGKVANTYSDLSAAENYAENLAHQNPGYTYTVTESKSSFRLRETRPVDKKVHI